MIDQKITPPAFLSKGFEEGQKKLAEKIKFLIYKTAPDLFSYLDFNNDDTFLNPYLFTYFVCEEKSLTLEQILIKNLVAFSNENEIEVYVNKEGVIELPGIGYLQTDVTNTKLTLRTESFPDSFDLTQRGKEIKYKFEPSMFVLNREIELSFYNNPYLNYFLTGSSNADSKFEIPFFSKTYIKEIENSFILIKQHLPKYYSKLVKAVKRIVIYRHDMPFSFASLGCHGTIFLNVPKNSNEIFFSEDLIHQGGHVIFNAISETKNFMNISKETLMVNLNNNDRDTRNVFEVLHGIYTETWMNLFWNSCNEKNDFTQEMTFEMLGRFTYILTRFGYDLKGLSFENIFSSMGEELFKWFMDVYESIVNHNYKLISKYDISKQPYCFDLELFKKDNPRYI
ncbi:hypothetical protein [Flavivirga jejuensis]|uniref:HEXXH motif-containing protein n=1 Tax=Flavivirga jejuensis TaxID=870487 RepID=A0ABT8WPZ2_9FLAO|nr:hypothetical protein [Flavivirga jejuensis]MDO5975203.1 hypothetical protein [Flavivirga jejuensis]